MKSNFAPKDSRMGVAFQPSASSFSGAFGEAKVVHDGQNGATFTPSVSEDGVLSWTNDRELDNPAPVNIKGPKGEAGEAGQQGPAGADGISPVVSVEDIDGGHRVTITDKDGEKTFDVMDGKDGTGGGGTSEAIIDVVELPTENINEDVFYRLPTGTFVLNQYFYNNGYTCYCVDGLPEVGEPATNAEMSAITTYYNTQDDELYGYVDAMLSMFFGVPVGWYPAAMLFQAAGVPYAGVITDILDDPMDGAIRILLEYVICSYKNGVWISHKNVGRIGSGISAEVFNHPTNIASGDYSHAEGMQTTASGESSHSEGMQTTASDPASHAEGSNTTASGNDSHAEGQGTIASGEASHSEGYGTVAKGNRCHVQGRFNIIENIQDGYQGKYAHIVGNGVYNARSNAHTLDWNGLGWFAGGLKVGGKGQDDPNAEEIPTKSQVQKMVDDSAGAMQADWNAAEGEAGHIKNRTHYEEKVLVHEPLNLTWDGNIEGLTEVVGVADPGMKWYKVSDDTFTDAEIYTMSAVFGGSSLPEASQWMWCTPTEDCMSAMDIQFVVFVRKANAVAFPGTNFAQTFPEVGVYFFKADEEQLVTSLTSTEPVNHTKIVLKTIEPKYLPEALRFGEMSTGGDTLTWDGNTEGLLEVPIVNEPSLHLYKVHDGVFSDDEIRQMTMYFDGSPFELEDCYLNEQSFMPDRVVVPGRGDPFIIFIRTSNYVFTEESDSTGFLVGTTFPETGVYFFKPDQEVYTNRLDFPGSGRFPSTKLMDAKYLPMDDIAAAIIAALPIYNGEVEEV